MTSKWKNLENSFQKSLKGHELTCHDQIWWRPVVERVGPGIPDKKIALPESSKPQVLPPLVWSHPKFPERRCPLTCASTSNLVSTGCGLPELLLKDWFFRRPKLLEYSFQPTIKMLLQLLRMTNSLLLCGNMFSTKSATALKQTNMKKKISQRQLMSVARELIHSLLALWAGEGWLQLS